MPEPLNEGPIKTPGKLKFLEWKEPKFYQDLV